MSLLLRGDVLAQRKRDLQDPTALGGLAHSLQRELHQAHDVPIPEGKSRLTRHGGRCPTCTVLLTFDPRQPIAHTCPSCGTVYTDRVHHEWWLMNAHLWTAEQCTRAAALGFLLDDPIAARRADDILAAYTERYQMWPNRDNALGPTRPFFSTYLESIWLLHLTTALDLRIAANGGVSAWHADALDRLVAPSAALIAGFDEGRSNRQVWHAAALLSASGLLDDRIMRRRAAESVQTLIRTGLHSDGSWYEGENYHLFAHRGLLSGVTLAEQAGIELPPDLIERFELGFVAPFRTMMPDGTFPARRDSQYGIALRQYRTADWAECGMARRDTPAMRAALASLYASWPERGETHRWASTADAERNVPGVRLSRADCSWRALLLARLELPALADAVPHSELLEGQGLAVFRRDEGRFWVGLDYGDPGDGHGHPDRLNLVIATQESRWLDDVGTGSYTSSTLAWYRSSMAHNAPMVNGRDQGEARGKLLAHEEQGSAGWVSAEFSDPLSTVRFVRTVVVLADHLLDEITWTSATEVTVDIPMQAQMTGESSLTWTPFVPGTTQDAMLSSPESTAIDADTTVALVLSPLASPTSGVGSPDPSRSFVCALWSKSASTLWRAGTIGPPAGAGHGLVSLRQHGLSGRSLRVIAWPDAVEGVRVAGSRVTVQTSRNPTRFATHLRVSDGWHIEHDGSERRALIALGGARDAARAGAIPEQPAVPSATRIVAGRSFSMRAVLGERHYRPTEESWAEARQPQAHVHVSRDTDAARIEIETTVILSRTPAFCPRIDVNPLDNELPDVNSDGVQLHWRSPLTGQWNSAVAVPEGITVRLTACEGSLEGLSARWGPTADGFEMFFQLSWPENWPELEFDLIINERPAGRERRRGQLVLSGAHGDFAYLRGARQSPGRALHVVFDPALP